MVPNAPESWRSTKYETPASRAPAPRLSAGMRRATAASTNAASGRMRNVYASLAAAAPAPSAPPAPRLADASRSSTDTNSLASPGIDPAHRRVSTAGRAAFGRPFRTLANSGESCHDATRLTEVTPCDAFQGKHGEGGWAHSQHLSGKISGLQPRVKPSNAGIFPWRGESREHWPETVEKTRCRAPDQGQERRNVPDHHEAVPQAAGGKERLRECRSRLLPEPAHTIRVRPRELSNALARFDPSIAHLRTVRDDAKQDEHVRSRPDKFEGPIDVRHECLVVGNVVIRRKDGDRSPGSYRAQAEQSVEDRRRSSAVLRLDHHALRGDVPK